MEKYIMALDQGTTSSRCILYNHRGEIVSSAQKEFRQIYTKPGWVEHDGMEIWSTQIGVAQEALYKVNATYQNIEAIGITNQRETTMVWDKNTGNPITNAIVWQCRRTADYCDQLKSQGYTEMIKEKTGLLIDAYFSATKLHWILENVPQARERAEKGELLFGTIETWLIWKLTNGGIHVTDYSNASRTMIFNINTLSWDEELLKLFNIPKSMLPKPVPSSKYYGHTNFRFFGGEIPIAGAAGDQQAALFGQTCFEAGEGKMTYGTGGFMLMNTGEKPLTSRNGLLTTIAWGLEGEVNYALEGSIFVAGAALQWLRDELEIIEDAKDSEAMALSVNDTQGVYFVPAFVGLGAPHWDPYARGTIVGITRGANRKHLVRATLESLVYQTKDLADAMMEDQGKKIATFNVDGGAAANRFLMQFLSDILKQDIIRPTSVETTSLGAAYLAGLAVGFWDGKEDIKKNRQIDHIYQSKMSEEDRKEKLKGWHKAVGRSGQWIDDK